MSEQKQKQLALAILDHLQSCVDKGTIEDAESMQGTSVLTMSLNAA
jgi:hypothetical protein